MGGNKILVTLPFPKEMISTYDDCVKRMEALGFEVVLDPRGRALKEDELLEYAPDLYADVCSTDAWSARVLEAAPNLRVISRMGVGHETIDVKAAAKQGVAVTITKGANAFDVAEFTLAMILALSRKLREADVGIRNGEWKRSFGHSLRNKTLGIIGLGGIGRYLTELVAGFDMKILATDIYHDEEFAKKHNVQYCSLEELLRESDIVTVHLHVTDETRGLIGEAELKSMKPTAMFINCSRGAIVDEKALYQALVDKTIAGAALDVFEKEPIDPDNPLLALDNVILSAHTAGISQEGRGKLVEMAFQQVIDIYEGRVPEGVLNKDYLNNL